jgi:hypothetical protein
MRRIKGGGFDFLTDDPFLIAAVRRCAELERLYTEARNNEVARFRSLRRDIKQIKRSVLNKGARDEKPTTLAHDGG